MKTSDKKDKKRKVAPVPKEQTTSVCLGKVKKETRGNKIELSISVINLIVLLAILTMQICIIKILFSL